MGLCPYISDDGMDISLCWRSNFNSMTAQHLIGGLLQVEHKKLVTFMTWIPDH